MAQASLMISGIYWRHWRVTIPALDGGAPKSLLQLLQASADYQPGSGDDTILSSWSDYFCGAALKILSGNIRLFGPKAQAPAPGSAFAPYIPGASNANGHLFNPTTQGDWTENCSQLAGLTWVCSDTNATTRTADLIIYLRKWPQLVQP